MPNRTIIERNRRVAITETDGIACGPCDMTAIDAEIKIEENGEKRYLSAQWVYACEEELLLKVTKESLFSLYTNPEVTDEIIEETNRILNDEIVCDFKATYPEQYEVLVQMVNEKLAEIGVDRSF